LWRGKASKNLAQMKADARKTRRWLGVVYRKWATRWISRRGFSKSSSGQSRRPVAICVFCVHLLLYLR
jgi:hypothetical protein